MQHPLCWLLGHKNYERTYQWIHRPGIDVWTCKRCGHEHETPEPPRGGLQMSWCGTPGCNPGAGNWHWVQVALGVYERRWTPACTHKRPT